MRHVTLPTRDMWRGLSFHWCEKRILFHQISTWCFDLYFVRRVILCVRLFMFNQKSWCTRLPQVCRYFFCRLEVAIHPNAFELNTHWHELKRKRPGIPEWRAWSRVYLQVLQLRFQINCFFGALRICAVLSQREQGSWEFCDVFLTTNMLVCFSTESWALLLLGFRAWWTWPVCICAAFPANSLQVFWQSHDLYRLPYPSFLFSSTISSVHTLVIYITHFLLSFVRVIPKCSRV